MEEKKPKAALLLLEAVQSDIYSDASIQRIRKHVDLLPASMDKDNWREHRDTLAEVELIFSGWGMAKMDASFLEAAPRLRHVFYGSGSVRSFYGSEALERGVGISSAWRANAVPVAEFSHAAIILSLKRLWRIQRIVRQTRTWKKPIPVPGAFRSVVGLTSLGAIGRMVAQHLATHALSVLAYDPFISPAEASEWGVTLVDLPTLFRESDVVSIHTPDLPETRGLVNRELLSSMKEGATLINTARGRVIDEDALIDVLRTREDLEAILDVTADEPDNADSPLWDLPNAQLSPHIAGSMDKECRRMGEYMVEELERYMKGEPLQHLVTEELLETMA